MLQAHAQARWPGATARHTGKSAVAVFTAFAHRVPNFQTYQPPNPRHTFCGMALFRRIAPLEGSCYSDSELAKEAAGIGQSTCCNGGCYFTRLQPPKHTQNTRTLKPWDGPE